MKNILTIAVITPSYYFGWYIHGCFQPGSPAQGHTGSDLPGLPDSGFCGLTAPWSAGMGPNLEEGYVGHLSLVFFLAFLLFLDDRLDHVGRAHRACPPVCLPHPHGAPRLRRLDHGRRLGLGSGGWLVLNYGFDSIASLVVHGVAGPSP